MRRSSPRAQITTIFLRSSTNFHPEAEPKIKLKDSRKINRVIKQSSRGGNHESTGSNKAIAEPC